MLAELTGRERRTIKKRLEAISPIASKRKGQYYDIKEAMRCICDASKEIRDESGELINPVLEKAKLDRERRISMELDNEQKQRNLIPRDEIKEVLAKGFVAIKAKIMSVPTKAVHSLPENLTKRQLKDFLSNEMKNALRELAEIEVNESLQ